MESICHISLQLFNRLLCTLCLEKVQAERAQDVKKVQAMAVNSRFWTEGVKASTLSVSKNTGGSAFADQFRISRAESKIAL
jgi:hypothetical protein